MNRDRYSNHELSSLAEQLNQEILRRGTYRWWDPLSTPTVGQDRTPPLSLPAIAPQVPVDDQTYTINNPSVGSIERTRNILYPAHGQFPAGEKPGKDTPSTSAAAINVDELRNALVGLAKIQDINLFYGRDEIPYLAFRDPKGIEDVLKAAQNDVRSAPLDQADIAPIKMDPNAGIITHRHAQWPQPVPLEYPTDDHKKYIMPSGERDGEEAFEPGLGPENFFDDYGAPEGIADYHPYNPAVSASPDRDTDQRRVTVGGIPSASYGPNPRNPNPGESYPSVPVYGGVATSCKVACTGLCYLTCDNQCAESCTTSCWNRCGNACTSTCGNLCTGCTTMCFNTCKTKCENTTGYSCVKAGAKAVKIEATGGHDGIPAKNEVTVEIYTCTGCSYSCQFYPNKKTTCWDAGCMGKCFTSCNASCSTSCYGGCVDNAREDGDGSYRTGHGRGCSGGCTLNCIGTCTGTCEGFCINTCFHGCKATCTDNCSWTCSAECGNGCEVGCTQGCDTNCISLSVNLTTCDGNCEASCEHGCSKNCVAIGCKSICGTGSAEACESNCRLNCSGTSCTSLCSDSCISECTTCVNTCGWQCGACSTKCSTGCESECNITCSSDCEHSCTDTCVHSCTEECGGCSGLCYSCVGMCIGICSMKCEAGCTNCANNCSWWCDDSCSRQCFMNCDNRCISTCSGSCSTFLKSETTFTDGPEKDPTAVGYKYKHPKNRWEERESFKLFQAIAPYMKPAPEKKPITIVIDKKTRNIEIIDPIVKSYVVYQTSITAGVYTADQDGKIHINENMLVPDIEMAEPNVDQGLGIYIIVLRTPGFLVTKDDIMYRIPIGYRGFLYGYDSDKNAIVVIERDLFCFPDCECKDYVEMTEDQFMEIWECKRQIIPNEDTGFLTGITENELREIWKSDRDPSLIAYARECAGGHMYEISDHQLRKVWKKEMDIPCECEEFKEMTPERFMEIINDLGAQIPDETGDPLSGMTEEQVETIWKSDLEPDNVPKTDPCDCESMNEADEKEIQDAWEEGMKDE